jgi:hypothetical protein
MMAESGDTKNANNSWWSRINYHDIYSAIYFVCALIIYGATTRVDVDIFENSAFSFFNLHWLGVFNILFCVVTSLFHYLTSRGIIQSGKDRRYLEYSLSATHMTFALIALNSWKGKKDDNGITKFFTDDVKYYGPIIIGVTLIYQIWNLYKHTSKSNTLKYTNVDEATQRITEKSSLLGNGQRGDLEEGKDDEEGKGDEERVPGYVAPALGELKKRVGKLLKGYAKANTSKKKMKIIGKLEDLGYVFPRLRDYEGRVLSLGFLYILAALGISIYLSGCTEYSILNSALLTVPTIYFGYLAECALMRKDDKLNVAKFLGWTLVGSVTFVPFFVNFWNGIIHFQDVVMEEEGNENIPDLINELLWAELATLGLFLVVHLLKYFCKGDKYGDNCKLEFGTTTLWGTFNQLDALVSFAAKLFLVIVTSSILLMGEPTSTTTTTVAPISTTAAPISTTAAPALTTTVHVPTDLEVLSQRISHFETKRSAAHAAGQCTYSQMLSDSAGCDGKVILLQNSDFTYGTLTLETGYYKLVEDIIFNPNAGTDSFPTCFGPGAQPLYCDGDNANRFRLGFFAAIAMRTTEVHIDLNGIF